MKKTRLQTARVEWRMGQSLLPEHFYAQEASLREESWLRLRMAPVPAWGVASLDWDDGQLAKGVVSIRERTLFLASGTLIDVPGNAAPPQSFNLNKTGSSHTPLYLHLASDYEVVAQDAAGDEDPVERVEQLLGLSATPISDRALQSFKLAELEKSVDGTWSLSRRFVPPSTRVTGTPFYGALLSRARTLIGSLERQILEEIGRDYLGGEKLTAAKECLKAVYHARAFLANVGQQIHPHPWELYRAIHGLYIDLCVFREVPPTELERVYAHDDAAGCFGSVLDAIEVQIRSAPTGLPYVPFTRKEGLEVCALPEAARRARQVYVLFQKPRVGMRLDTSGVKLGSESRIGVVHQLALRGIPYRRIESPPFHHGFSAEVEFYALADGEEWDHAVREGRLAFYRRGDLEQVRAFVYWRND